ncbi:MAG: multicopper oxidase family protein [Proteobacteria bacterium]|nr:multicopper oxidase family protein [Pseudomonadota bacterium]
MISRRNFLSVSAATFGAALTLPPFRLNADESKPYQILAAKPGTAPLAGANAPPVKVWAYQGQVPGPVIRARRGEKIRVRLNNGLAQPTTIHWHGIRIDNAMDGVPGLTQDAVQPGKTFDYSFTVPDAGTYWYHPHHLSWEQVARGLYGLLIVEEETPPMVDRELPFVADDWRLNKAGQIDDASFGNLGDWSHGGRMGNWLTVNGLTDPEIPVRGGERIRLRMVNTANARVLAFDFAPLTAQVIALDGQPVSPWTLGAGGLRLAPGQRADIILDIPAEPGAILPIQEVSTRNPIKAATFKVAAGQPLRAISPNDPIVLAPNRLLAAPTLDSAQLIELLMEGGAMGGLRQGSIDGAMVSIEELVQKKLVWAFNGAVGMQKKPLATIPRGRTAVINMVNRTAFPHAMHLHGHHFRVVERNGKTVHGAPWRDTELANPDERVRIAFVADNPGKWLFHCHTLEHTAAGMVTWVEVV